MPTQLSNESRSFLNVVRKTADDNNLTIYGDETTKAREMVDRVDATNRANQRQEAEWRAELESIEHQVAGAWTEEQAKQNADAVTRQHNQIVRDIEGNIKELRKVLETPFLNTHVGFSTTDKEPLVRKGKLCGCDGCSILTKIERFEYALPQAKQHRERAIKLAGSAINSSRERDKLRPRLAELRKRAAQIDDAVSRTSERGFSGGLLQHEGTPQRAHPGAHRTPAALTYEK